MNSHAFEVRKMCAVSNHKSHYWLAVYRDGEYYRGCWLTKREAVQELQSIARIWR